MAYASKVGTYRRVGVWDAPITAQALVPSALSGTKRTFSVWFRRDSNGSSDYGRVYALGHSDRAVVKMQVSAYNGNGGGYGAPSMSWYPRGSRTPEGGFWSWDNTEYGIDTGKWVHFLEIGRAHV